MEARSIDGRQLNKWLIFNLAVTFFGENPVKTDLF
jgi:hypothetical protein